MYKFYDSEIVQNFQLTEEAIKKERQIVENNNNILCEFQKCKLLKEGMKNWDKFYKHYKTNFFKNRNWIEVEFAYLFNERVTCTDLNNETSEKSNHKNEGVERKLVLEFGCGVGNTIIPLLMKYEHLDLIGVDFSKNAIELLNEKWNEIQVLNEELKKIEQQEVEILSLENNESSLFSHNTDDKNNKSMEKCSNGVTNGARLEGNNVEEDSDQENHTVKLEKYQKLGNLIKTAVFDITSEETPKDICEFGSVDIILLIYVLSAIDPNKMSHVIEHSYKFLRKGGVIILRDYGLYDISQVRFAKKREKKISNNFYVRGDKTFVYFFKKEELHDMFCKDHKFEEIENRYITRIVKNRKRNLEMKRIWVQSIFKKL